MTCAHRCHQVDLDAGLPAGFGIPAAETGRVVDQNVDATERLAGCCNVSADRLAVSEIARCGMDRVAINVQLGLDRFQSFQIACANGHGGASLREPERDAAADAARAP